MSLEEEGKQFADNLLTSLTAANISSGLDNPQESFQSGVYWGAVQGYKKGVNTMIEDIAGLLPVIYNEIVESGCDMTRDWIKRYIEIIIEKRFKQ